jgi:pimeloyl-ACP methyl ester carboxylesterase
MHRPLHSFSQKTYLMVGLSFLPLSLFLIGVALGQSVFTKFCLWSSLSFLLTGLPLFAAIRPYGLDYITSPKFSPVKPSEQQRFSLSKYGDQQDWMWRGWRIRYTSILNPQSQVHVFLLHGFGGSIGHWRQNIAELAKHHNVHALDLLGFGASDKPVTPYTIQLWAEQVYEFWATFVKVPVILVGNSIGAVTCLSLAASYPEMVRGVAMISLPHTAQSTKKAPALLRPFRKILQSIFTSSFFLEPLFHLLRQPWVVKHWASLAYTCKEAITDELLEILIAPAREHGAAKAFCAIFQGMFSPQFFPNIQAILSNLKLPSLMVWGKKDRMVPVNLAQQCLNYNSTAQLILLENAGHCAHDECPDQVNREILNWIQMQVLAA